MKANSFIQCSQPDAFSDGDLVEFYSAKGKSQGVAHVASMVGTEANVRPAPFWNRFKWLVRHPLLGVRNATRRATEIIGI